jgi:hypothetical protein
MLVNRLCSAKKAVPVGMFCLIAGLLVVNLSAFLPRLHVAGLAQPSQVGDFLRGFGIGLGIAFEILAIVIMLPAARAACGQRRGA